MRLKNIIICSAILLFLSGYAKATSNYPPPANIRITNTPQLNNEEQVWICPTDSNIIIANWRDFRLGYRQVGVGRSTDGGLTWIDSLISQSMQVFFTDSWQSDPTMTVDRLGNFYMSILDWDVYGFTNESYIAFYKSIDKGISWTGPFKHVTGANNQVFEDKQFITVDRTGGPFDGNVYCTWARFPNTGPNRMAFVRSTDGGMTFDDTLIIGPPQSSSACGSGISSGQFPIPLVNSNGDVHCFWLGTVLDSGVVCSGYDGIKHVVSTDGGQSFNSGEVVIEASGWSIAMNGTNTYSNPVVDADITGGPFDGNIYMSYTNYGPEDASRSDIDFIYSTDNALSWSARQQINDDTTAPASDSYHPWLIVNDEGVVIVIFYDTRFDSPSHLLFDLVAAYSFDGGLTFTSNHRISNVSSSAGDLKRDHQLNAPVTYDEEGNITPGVFSPMAGLIGEYIGVTSFHDKVNAVWTDSRDGNSEAYSANWYLPILEPRLIEPSDSAFSNAYPTFKWATSWKNNQDTYRLEVSVDSNFAGGMTQLVDTNSYVTPQQVLFFEEGTYYWRVKAFKSDYSDSSEYSETRVLHVDLTPPNFPQLLTPANNFVTNNPLPSFDWTDVVKSSAAIYYDFYISSDSTFPDPASATDLTVSSYNLSSPLAEHVRNFWKVAAKDPAGNETPSPFFAITYIDFECGDVNNDLAGPNILDLTYLVDFIFRGGPIPPIPAAADVDGSGGNPNIIDLTKIVDRIFRGGPLLTCGQ